MSLSQDDVKKIAKLARLSLSDKEIDVTLDKLNDVFGLIKQMNEIDATGVEPMSHPGEMSLRLREDEVTETDHRDEYQKNAPQVQDGLFLVPKVIE